MDGNNKKQVEHLKKKTCKFASTAKSAKVSRFQAKLGFETTIMKTLEYLMEAINVTKKEWETIMSPALNCILSKLAINRKFPQKLVYAPTKFSGLGIKHPYYLQNIKQLAMMLQESENNGITRDIIIANIKQLWLESSINKLIALWPMDKINCYLTDCWLKSLLNFCNDNDIKIYKNMTTMTKQTRDDVNLMTAFFENRADKDTLYKLNICRIFLKVMRLSKIVSVDGKEIVAWAWEGKKNLYTSYEIWPRQLAQLGESFWNPWRSWIGKCFLSRQNNRKSVKTKVGGWVAKKKHEWFWDQEQQRAFHQRAGSFEIWRKESNRHTRLANIRIVPTGN